MLSTSLRVRCSISDMFPSLVIRVNSAPHHRCPGGGGGVDNCTSIQKGHLPKPATAPEMVVARPRPNIVSPRTTSTHLWVQVSRPMIKPRWIVTSLPRQESTSSSLPQTKLVLPTALRHQHHKNCIVTNHSHNFKRPSKCVCQIKLRQN